MNATPNISPARLSQQSVPELYTRALTQIAASDLDVPVLGQRTPPQLPLGGFLKACPLQMVCFNAAFGGGCLRQQALEHAPGYPHDAAIFADFNAEFDSLPLGIPSGVIGKGEEHRRIR